MVATDDVTLAKDIMFKNNLNLLFNLIEFVNGPIQKQDRVFVFSDIEFAT